MVPTLELTNCTPDWRNRPASAWIFLLTSVGCQCQRSLALVSAGIKRPPGGLLYSRNSTCAGTTGGIIAVTRQVSLIRPSSTSCVVPLFKVVTPTAKPSASRENVTPLSVLVTVMAVWSMRRKSLLLGACHDGSPLPAGK